MTVANPNNKNIFVGDGVTTVFGYTFQLPVGSTGSDILFFVFDDEGNMTQITSNITINVGASQFTYPVTGGIAPLDVGVNALPVGWNIVAVRVEPITQGTNLTTLGPFPAASLMAMVDYLTLICQQLQEQIDRSFKAPINETVVQTDLSAFLAAISAVFPPFSTDIYANLKVLSAGTPTQKRWGLATDLNGGQGQLCFYTAVPSSGDAGWFLVPIQFFG